jgi:hypothetical protein
MKDMNIDSIDPSDFNPHSQILEQRGVHYNNASSNNAH